jgi:hypothetical protein|tara:strand:- start:294 stop:545 length:252 start_codon:yes stop_codon:yes gene_type:complete
MSFWDDAKSKLKPAKANEEVVDLQQKLSKLELSDINYIYDMMLNGNYRGREIEQATTTYLKVKFIKAMLEQGDSNGKEEVESS